MTTTTTFTPDSIALVDGEIYLTPNRDGKTFTWQGGQLRNFYATTNTSIPNVKHIDRIKFMKPDVDVEELAHTNADRLYNRSELSQGWVANVRGFVDGYNSNKKEFTIEELKTAWAFGVEASQGFDEIIKILRPLSIPKSVICDQEYNLIEVKF